MYVCCINGDVESCCCCCCAVCNWTCFKRRVLREAGGIKPKEFCIRTVTTWRVVDMLRKVRVCFDIAENNIVIYGICQHWWRRRQAAAGDFEREKNIAICLIFVKICGLLWNCVWTWRYIKLQHIYVVVVGFIASDKRGQFDWVRRRR